MTEVERKAAAAEFAKRWKGKGGERSECQTFWLSLLHDVYGVEHPDTFIEFEEKVALRHAGFIDAEIPSSKVVIEQKSLGKDLNRRTRQSDGQMLSPFEQAKRYIGELPYSRKPRWVVTCNFERFHVHDMDKPGSEPHEILLEDLPEQFHRLDFLIGDWNAQIKREMEVSIAAGEIVGLLRDALGARYADPDSEAARTSLNILCVRLVFCLYAEDAGVFGRRGLFHEYLAGSDTHRMRKDLEALFEVLDTKEEDRSPYLEKDDPVLAAFPYVDGGLFARGGIEIPPFTDEIRDLLLTKASAGFDWSQISPTIFGAVFESTLNPETRRKGGMHYTSIENIHKVIDPLFLDGLRKELEDIKALTVDRTRSRRLDAFRRRLASLVFLDPACGSGNFLTETYISLRRLENEALRLLAGSQTMFADQSFVPIEVSIKQCYGIEINDFAVSVARTALWIAENQMLQETEDILGQTINFLPLQSYPNIVEGNALEMDWETVVPKGSLSYIMGNPPFRGARLMDRKQSAELNKVFEGWKNAGNLDYVSCWFKLASDLMRGTPIRAALVSTNSISQGDAPAILWKPLFASGVHIDFAHQTFRWDSEASQKAHVHCVIVGFSASPGGGKKTIFTTEGAKSARNINGYLVDGPDLFVESRIRPLCDVPEIGIGNKPIDGGQYLFTKEEMEEFIRKEPRSEGLFRPWYGSKEFINRSPRYCLWLGGLSPAELRGMPECLRRVELVRQLRLSSKSEGTRKLADTPTRFHVENMPTGTYVIIPKVSSENRSYIPIGFMDPETMASDLVFILPDVGLYHFGVLMSSVHMAWTRAVCGRLKSDYRYSKNIVYNNFPWPSPTAEQKAAIERTAQAVLDARELYLDSSLADLYDDVAMPKELRKAHNENDKAVMAAYGFPRTMGEKAVVAALLELHRRLAGN